MNRFRLRLEERVENRDHPVARQAVRALGEAAEVRRPENSGQLLARTATDLPR